jgi:hypothetical protein
VIGTTALLSGFSLLGLPGAALLDQGRAVALGWANLLLAAVGLTYSLVLLWSEVILRRTATRAAPPPETTRETTSFSFAVTLDDGREVAAQKEAQDFASAVASAIAELERSGGKVVKIERT